MDFVLRFSQGRPFRERWKHRYYEIQIYRQRMFPATTDVIEFPFLDAFSERLERREVERMGGVLEGNLPNADPVESDPPTGGINDTGERSVRGGVKTAPEGHGAARRGRRDARSAVSRGMRRLWIPFVVLVVFAAGGFTVARLHGIFGSDNSIRYSDTKVEDTKPFDPKQLRYEVFGPPGTVADISYFDGNGEPQSEDKARLPWSFEFPMTGAMGIGSIAAQGDSDSIGCRIVVDGVVKDEKIATHEISTFTSCRLKAA